MFRWLALRLIDRYRRSGGQRCFAVDCNFEPSCSAYAEEAIRSFGFLRGCRLSWRRLSRCNRRDSFCKCLEPVPRRWDEVGPC